MAKKIPVPKVKSKKSGSSFPWYTTIAGIAGLLNRNPLTTSKITGANTATYGSKAWQAKNMANMAKMGQVSMANTPGFWAKTNLLGNRAIGSLGRFALGRAAMHPGVMIPAAGTFLAKHLVNKAFDPYRDETGKIGTEGHARLAMAARAREQGLRKEDMDLEPFLRAQQELELNRPTYAQLRESFLARQNQNAGGLAGLL